MPPKLKTPPRFKNEISPNNRSKCHLCGVKIPKGTQRYGTVELNEYGRTQRYYHPDCCPAHAKRKIPPLEESMQQEAHKELHEQLRRLRLLFAEELGVEPFRIFHNTSLDQLVEKMPQTNAELMEIWGIKERKVECFGSAILAVIRQYLRDHPTATPVAAPPRPTKRRKKTKRAAVVEEDDSIDVGETLTCEQIVQRKFEEAKQNGYVISVDDEGDEAEDPKEDSKPAADYQKLKISTLPNLCKDRGINIEGMREKSELVEALANYYSSKSISELRSLCTDQGIDMVGMREKTELVAALEHKSKENIKPQPTNFAKRSLKELTNLCKQRKISLDGMREKDDLVRALEKEFL